LFDSLVLSTKKKGESRRWLTLPVALIAHGIVFAGLIVTSFMTIESVPPPPLTISFVAAPPPPPPPPPPKRSGAKKPIEKPKEIPKPTELVQPKVVPEEKPVPITAPEEEKDEGVDGGVDGGVEGGVIGGVVGGVVGGVLGGVLGGVDGGMMDQPLYAGIGGVSNPEVIPSTRVQPTYPDLARKAKVAGQVVLQAVVRKDGTVGDITVLKSPGSKFGFDEAAIAAVKQWRYKPGLQNGKPVDVYFTVVVDFTLQ